MTRKFIIILGLILGLSVITGCSSVTTDSNEVALHYKGGEFSSKRFANCVDGQTRNYDGPGDIHAYYPAGERTFSFTGRSGSELDGVQARTANAVNLNVKGYVTFELETDCKTLREFHEKIGQKYGAYGEESGEFSSGALPKGWLALLNDYLATPLNSSVDNAGLKFDWKTLAYDADAQTKFEEEVKRTLPLQLSQTVRKYIKIKSVSIQPPEPPSDLVQALEAAEKAKAENEAQKQKNETARTQYQQIADCKAVASENYCLMQQLAKEGDIPFIVMPQDGNFHIDGLEK